VLSIYGFLCVCVWKTMGNTVDRGNSVRSSTPTALGCGSRPNVTVAQHKLVPKSSERAHAEVLGAEKHLPSLLEHSVYVGMYDASQRPQRRPGLRQSHYLNVLHRVLQSTLACFSCSPFSPSLVQASGDSGRSMQCNSIHTRFNGLVL